jgi:protein arginine kinase activator
MLCDQCKKRPVAVHFTQIINTEKVEMNLCEQCAAEKGGFNFVIQPNMALHNFFSSFLNPGINKPGVGTVAEDPQYKDLKCETCGLTYQQFFQGGKFGCAKCYDYFGDQLTPIFKRIHGSTHHTGKIPHISGSGLKLKREIQQLRDELNRCVEREEFERAAQLRDQIYRLEKEIEL